MQCIYLLIFLSKNKRLNSSKKFRQSPTTEIHTKTHCYIILTSLESLSQPSFVLKLWLQLLSIWVIVICHLLGTVSLICFFLLLIIHVQLWFWTCPLPLFSSNKTCTIISSARASLAFCRNVLPLEQGLTLSDLLLVFSFCFFFLEQAFPRTIFFLVKVFAYNRQSVPYLSSSLHISKKSFLFIYYIQFLWNVRRISMQSA